MANPSETAGPTQVPKRIIICCDGTWQSAVSGVKNCPSNVTRLTRNLERVATDLDGKVWQQVVWYDSGVGTTSSDLGKKVEGAIGKGLEGNVIEAYNFVALNYTPGDQIFCFGFSRGAYTARSIAGLISDIGVCGPRELKYFPEIWEQYKKMEGGERFLGSSQYWEFVDGKIAEPIPEDPGYKGSNIKWEKRPHGDWAVTPESRTIEVVGVYDTVGALGMPSVHGYEIPHLPFGPDKQGYHNVKLNRNIKRAFQALALDEHREAFSPTLWHLPEEYPYKDAAILKQHAEFETVYNEWHAIYADRKVSPANKRKVRSAYNKAREAIIELEKRAIEKQRQTIETLASEWYSVQANSKVSDANRKGAKARFNAARTLLIRMEEYNKPPPELLQVWFPGMHINVGGGSSDTLDLKGDLEEMSNICFAWMLDQIRPYLTVNETHIYQEAAERQKLIEDLNWKITVYEEKKQKEAEDAARDNWLQAGSRWLGRAATAVNTTVNPWATTEDPKVLTRLDFGWGTGALIDSYTTMYMLNGSKPRTPGAYAQDKRHTTRGRTHEQIHPVVGYRMHFTQQKFEDAQKEADGATDPKKKVELQAKAEVLKKLVYKPVLGERRKNAHGNWEYAIDGNEPLPEYNIRPSSKSDVLSYNNGMDVLEEDAAWYDLGLDRPSFERIAIDGEHAQAYMKNLDRQNGYRNEIPDTTSLNAQCCASAPVST